MNKSHANKRKHGIDFEKAKSMWDDDFLVLPATNKGENRFVIIGQVENKLYSCVFTLRGKKIRIISCRRSREKEKRGYYEKTE
ncbi:MAG: BrnT family toxin [Candidatus Omnitrophota bacterium]